MSRISGSSLLAAFDQEVAQRDAARSWLESQIVHEERQISAANAEREAAYTELAELYSADNGKLASSFGEISQRLQAIFNEKMQRRLQVNALIDQAAGLIANLRTQVPPAQEVERVAQLRLDETRRAVDAELATDDAYQAMKREADELKLAAARTEAERARIESECQAKRGAFEGNRLFRYLVDAKFGTPAYAAGGFTAAGDRWLARLVAWEKNFPSYATLCELPEFAKNRVGEAVKRSEFAATKVAFHVGGREVAHQVDVARTALGSAAQARQALQTQIDNLEKSRATLLAELQGIDTGSDAFQKRAKAEMKAFLTANPVEALKARAAATAGARDNELVGKIETAELTINEGRKRVKGFVVERTDAEDRHQRAVQARRKFSTSYTGTYDQFDHGMNVGDLLKCYITGSMTERMLWGSFDRHHHDATPRHTYHSSSDWGSSFSSSGGSDSSGGGFSGGGDSGGSFSTGGGD